MGSESIPAQLLAQLALFQGGNSQASDFEAFCKQVFDYLFPYDLTAVKSGLQQPIGDDYRTDVLYRININPEDRF